MPDEKPTAITVPMNDDGTIGALPDPLQKFLDAKIAQVAKRFEAKSAPIADPVDRERVRQLEEENQRFKVGEAEREKRYEEALKMREEDWTRKFKDAETAIERRTQRIVQLTGAEIRAAALRYEAREESLEDIEALLDRRVAINDDLQVVVLDDKGEPTDLTIDELVKATLDKKPYFRRAPQAGGGARGGAFASTGTTISARAAYDAALAQWQRVQNGETLKALQEAKLALQE
jgi:hypothetical protein